MDRWLLCWSCSGDDRVCVTWERGSGAAANAHRPPAIWGPLLVTKRTECMQHQTHSILGGGKKKEKQDGENWRRVISSQPPPSGKEPTRRSCPREKPWRLQQSSSMRVPGLALGWARGIGDPRPPGRKEGSGIIALSPQHPSILRCSESGGGTGRGSWSAAAACRGGLTGRELLCQDRTH